MDGKENIDEALTRTLHHVAPHKPGLMVAAARSASELKDFIDGRFLLVRTSVQATIDQLQKIRSAAEQGDCTEVLRLLDEKVTADPRSQETS